MSHHRGLTVAAGLWPTFVVVDAQDRAALNTALLPLLLKTWAETSTGSEHYERVVHNIFASDNPAVLALKTIVLDLARSHYDLGEAFEFEGHEIVSQDRQFIKTHVDSEEGDLTLQYFVRCPAGNAALAVNQFGNAAFVLVNPAQPAGSFRFPNEQHHEYPVLPRDGLLVMYRSYTPHYQCPYQGDAPMVQVVCNIKLKRVSH